MCNPENLIIIVKRIAQIIAFAFKYLINTLSYIRPCDTKIVFGWVLLFMLLLLSLLFHLLYENDPLEKKTEG